MRSDPTCPPWVPPQHSPLTLCALGNVSSTSAGPLSPHLTGIPSGCLLVSSLCMLHQLFPTHTSSPLLLFTWSPIPESHLLKPSLPLLFLSPIPTYGQIPRIATILQIHSFFAILTSILTSSTLRAYHLYSLDVPNGVLAGSVGL